MSKRTAVITGASAGIGLEIAKYFAADGFDLFLVARRREKLEKACADLSARYKIRAAALVKDLSRPESAAEVFRETASADIRALVNNAGFGLHGRFQDTDLERELEMIRLNISAVTELTKRFLPAMLHKKKGWILNVASTAAFQPGPLMAVYYATKAYVLSFSEAVAEELRGTGVRVSVLCPGPTESDFMEIAGIHRGVKVFRAKMPSEEVAHIAYRELMRGRRTIVPGFLNKLVPVGVRIAPRALVTRIVRHLQEAPGP